MVWRDLLTPPLMDVLGLLGAGVVCLRRDVYTSVRMINREQQLRLLGTNWAIGY